MQKSDTKLKPTHQRLNRLQQVFQHGDRPWQVLIISMSILVLATMLAIGWMLWQQSSVGRATFGWSFLTPSSETSWDPVGNHFNSWPMIYGTLITSLVAIVLALPLGLGVAIFLAELCPDWLRTPLGLMVELLAAIPSVVYGLWGIFIFLPALVTPVGTIFQNTLGLIPVLNTFFAGPIPVSGASRLAAGLILAIMIVPTIAAVSRDVFLAIPGSQREASLALGATQWETISKVIIPYGLSGILGAVILGLGRALGETMAVTMVIGNSIEGSLSLLKPGYTMSSIIANEFAEAVTPTHTSVLIEVGFILFIMTLILNVGARLLVWRVGRRTNREARA
ncbi:MAG: phosphate ABC transporter permease subunit PstC [Anaerolineaceae bacterium]|nr:phosphate ABC transporter permease subunit PstC [Anaerolineaceae bacterium]